MDEIKLNAKDKKILYQLDVNARQSLSQIARKVGMSREAVGYRVKGFEDKGVIQGYYAAIDIAKLGYMYCRVLIKYANINLKEEKEILQTARALPYIGWVSCNDGRWDLTLVVWAKNITDFEKAYDDLRFKLSKYFQETYVSIAFRIYHFKHNYLFGTRDISQAILGEAKSVQYDDIDTKILRLLTKNARMAAVDIAQRLKLAPNTVKGRITRMQKEGVIIAFRPKINIDALGYEHYKVFLILQSMNEQKQKELIAYLRYDPNVVYVTKAFGIADLEFEVMLKGKNKLHEFIRALREKFSDIIKGQESLLCYSEPLINYLPG